jgi:hypothetical protein
MDKKIVGIIVGAFIAGIILTVFSYHAYVVYSMKTTVEKNDVILKQVVDFINKGVAAQQPQSGAAPAKTK